MLADTAVKFAPWPVLKSHTAPMPTKAEIICSTSNIENSLTPSLFICVKSALPAAKQAITEKNMTGTEHIFRPFIKIDRTGRTGSY